MAETAGYAHATTLAATPDLTASLAAQLREANATIQRVRRAAARAAKDGLMMPIHDVLDALDGDRG